MNRSERVALTGIAVIVIASSAASFGESYRALLDWAAHHGQEGIWTWIWPMMIDSFIAVGELALFVALVRGWPSRTRVTAWAVTVTGLAVSVAANMGHATGGVTDRLTWAVPPLAAAASLTVGLTIVKWTQRSEAAAVTVQRGHGDQLAALTSSSKKVIYAAQVTGHRDPHTITTWLAGQGHDIPPETARTALRRSRAQLNGAEHHEQSPD